MPLAQLVSALNWGSLQRAKEFIVLAGRVVLVLDAYRCSQAQDSSRLGESVIDLLPSNRCLLTAVVRGLSTVQLKSTCFPHSICWSGYQSYQCAAHSEVDADVGGSRKSKFNEVHEKWKTINMLSTHFSSCWAFNSRALFLLSQASCLSLRRLRRLRLLSSRSRLIGFCMAQVTLQPIHLAWPPSATCYQMQLPLTRLASRLPLPYA